MARRKRRVWRGRRRGMLRKLLRTLNSFIANDVRETAKATADATYNPLIFQATGDVAALVAGLKAVVEADLSASA